jgi:hypothetical protein
LLLHSGYNTVPKRKMLWEQKLDCHNELISNAIRRHQVDAVLSCLHFRDNSKIDEDSYFKVKLKICFVMMSTFLLLVIFLHIFEHSFIL